MLIFYAPAVLISSQPEFEHTFFQWLGESLRSVFVGEWAGLRLVLETFGVAFMCLAAVSVHECGHLFAGQAVGFHFREVRVWRIQFDRHLRLARYRHDVAGALGAVRFSPDSMRNRPLATAFMIFAGPLANLISGSFPLALPVHKSLLGGSFIGFSFFFGFVNLLPFRSWGTPSDGMRLLLLLWKRANFERTLALAEIGENLSRGVVMEQLSKDLLATAIGVRDRSLQTVLAYTIAYAGAYDQHRDDDAAHLLETCLRYSGYGTSSLREACVANAAIFQAERRKRVDLAKQWLSDLPSKPAVPYRRLMVEATILEAQQDYPEALKKVNEIKRIILAGRKPGQRDASASFEKWRGELEEKAKSSASSPFGPQTV
jgi:hypothetical protein